MQIDPWTLTLAEGFSALLAALVLFGAWWQFRHAPALLWGGIANLVGAFGYVFLIVGLADHHPALVLIGVGIMILAPALIWGGIERFYHRPIPVPIIVAGQGAWMVITLAPFADRAWLSTVAGFTLVILYLAAALRTLWCADEKLVARLPMMAVLAVHFLVYAGGLLELFRGSFVLGRVAGVNTWFGAIHFEAILFWIGIAVLFVRICKERDERDYIKAASFDALTGVFNRRAFFETAARLLERCRGEDAPFALIVFDLDHFKSINDTYGHQIGDRILRSFADTARGVLRPRDVFGRYGGEEFTVVLPAATVETAFAIAERVRRAFANSHAFFNGLPLNATVSAGVASACAQTTLERLIERADGAMYLAKNGGRNRVSGGQQDTPADRTATVIRVA